MHEPVESDRSFEPNRPRLFGIAYRMLGSRAEAEDVVQEAFVRWHQSDRAAIRNANRLSPEQRRERRSARARERRAAAKTKKTGVAA